LCESSFSINGRFPCDFLIIAADSGSWYAVFVFLGPACKLPFTATGAPSKHLSALLKRAADAIDYCQTDDDPLRAALSAVVNNRKPNWCAQNRNLGRGGLASAEILDIESRLEVSAKIVMGRRETLLDNDHRRRAGQRYRGNNCVVATYDRLLDMANDDNRAVPQGQDKAVPWWHATTEQPPSNYVGNISGTSKMLSLCLGAENPNCRMLAQKAQNGQVWVRKNHRTSYSVWFPTSAAYARANQIRIRLETPPPQSASK
jgi:hypothetical protein